MHKVEGVQWRSFYASLVIGLLIAVLLISTHNATAASYGLSAAIHAPSSPDPAVITQPSSGTTVTDSTVNVSGTCPVLSPQLIVVLWRGSTMLGSSVCSPSGNFAMAVTLVPGQNSITPKLRNITNDPGVDGSPIQINYSVPATAETPTSQATSTPASTTTSEQTNQALQVIPEKEFLTITADGQVILVIEIKYGDSPYALVVDWGDGSKTSYTFDTAGKKSLKHSYSSTHAKSIHLKITDKNGQVVTMVLGAEATLPTSKTTSESADPLPGILDKAHPYILIGAGIAAIVATIATIKTIVNGGSPALFKSIIRPFTYRNKPRTKRGKK